MHAFDSIKILQILPTCILSYYESIGFAPNRFQLQCQLHYESWADFEPSIRTPYVNVWGGTDAEAGGHWILCHSPHAKPMSLPTPKPMSMSESKLMPVSLPEFMPTFMPEFMSPFSSTCPHLHLCLNPYTVKSLLLLMIAFLSLSFYVAFVSTDKHYWLYITN